MKNNYLLKLLQLKNYTVIILFLLSAQSLRAQTAFTPGGSWDSGYRSGNAGTVVHNNGVVQLVSIASVAGAEGAAVHETSNLIPTGTAWSRCYNVYFGCPGNDNIGSDEQGDGMAWSLYLPQVAGCAITNGVGGGGLGYNSTGCSRMFTIEFDTYSSAFDGTYGGGTTGNNDEIAIQVNGNADGTTANKLTAVNAGNLEDGLEHLVCINYTPSGTHPNYNGTIVVTIDGVTRLSYALGATYSLEAFMDPLPVSGSSAPPYGNNNTFETGYMAQMWSAGKQNATDPATVTPDASTHIVPNLLSGTTLCPATVTISASTSGCSGDYVLSSTVIPPTGCTTTKVDFYDGATLVGTDATSPYSVTLSSPSAGLHNYTARATFSGSCGTQTSSIAATNVGASGGQMQRTSTPINVTHGSTSATIDAVWSSYTARTMNYKQNCSGSGINTADLGASFKVVYDDNFLYILVDVTDDISDVSNGGQIWNNDAVEIFLDGGKNGGYSNASPNGDAHYFFRRDAGATGEDHGYSMTNVTYDVLEKGAGLGYYMEIKISWATLGTPVPPTPGSSIGFEISVGDADNNTGACSNGSTDRDNIVSWNDGTFQSYSNINLLGTLNFSGCDPLPVDLLRFTAVNKNGTVVLDWATSSEKNNHKFIIERSNDGINWVSIGEVLGAGNTTSITNYTFTDAEPLDGISYYRLRQIDINGNASVSRIEVVSTSGQQISVSPNPFDDVFTIVTNIKGEINVSLYDIPGRLLYETTQEVTDGRLTIHPELTSGAYIVKVSAGEFMEHYRVIKK